ncbi:MAG: DUF1573 domain-containing protein [Bacteroidales bacterium]|nr:DUF1573 domain-containing protein [Bacteroidales bacterium]
MRVIRIIKSLAILVMLLFTTASSSQNSTNNIIEFNKLVHDFGDITLNSGTHAYTFKFKNTGASPIIIQTVISSCGCTTPVWTRNPVKPGESGKIEVTFLNDQGPYPFDKALTVYVSGLNRPIILRIKGVVHEKAKSLAQLFPYNIGALSFRSNYADIGQVAQGDIKRETITVANTGNRSVKIDFSNLPTGLNLTANPSTLAPGKKGEILVELDTKKERRWGATSLKSNIVINGKMVTSPKLEVRVRILDNFSNLSREDTEQAPLPMVDNNVYSFGSVKSGSKIQHTFEVRNLGRRALLFHKYDTNKDGINVSHPKSLAPGATAKFVVVLIADNEPGEQLYQITFITNSPARPAFNLLISGTVTR